MPGPFLTLRRFRYEEPYNLYLELAASNGTFSGAADMYRGVEELRELGQALRHFPARVPDEVVDQYGSDDPADRFYRLVRLRAYTVNAVGHCALQVAIDLNREAPHEGACRFSIPAEPAALNRLGELLVRFAELRHVELRWTPAGEGSGLFEEHELYE